MLLYVLSYSLALAHIRSGVGWDGVGRGALICANNVLFHLHTYFILRITAPE